MRQEIQRNEIRLDQLVAMVVALERFIEDPSYTEGATQESIRALEEELERHRSAIETMKESVSSLREDVERARFQGRGGRPLRPEGRGAQGEDPAR